MDKDFHVSSSDLERFCSHLDGLCMEHLNIAIIGRDSDKWPAAILACSLCGAVTVPLNEDLQLHEYKRLLNEHGCNCLIYSSDFDELAYMLENSGTTMVSEFISLDD